MQNEIDGWNAIDRRLSDAQALHDLAEEAKDETVLLEAQTEASACDAAIGKLEFSHMLSGEHDARNAILSINAGAGGTDSADWADMLLRMYTRWAERKGFDVTFYDSQPGDEAGIRSATILISGPYAYGYAKADTGVHRLVRISPFDANKRRHTSFASVFVTPELDDSIQVDVKEEDLRVDTFRAGGAGGQHVNTTDSAVRITHVPTGIVVQCQNERSQHKNRAMALKILQSRLYEHQMAEQRAKLDQLHASKKDNAWGSQIRSYVLHPYRLVKDHRTGFERGDVDAVLDGDLDSIIEAYLTAKSTGHLNAAPETEPENDEG